MSSLEGMVELNGVRIWAIGCEGDRMAIPRKLVCGTLARRIGVPDLAARLPPRIELPGRVGVWLGWSGWFELVPTGEVVAVYGAVVERVGSQAGEP